MARFEDHCFIDRKHLGREFPEVHRWLDYWAQTEGNRHRRRRHHREGVEELCRRWGDQAARAAELHILIDMGHIPSEADWQRGGCSDSNGDFIHMDGMGMLETAVTTLASGILLAPGTGYHARLPCASCNDEHEQALVDIREGIFRCSTCGSTNKDSDYRITQPHSAPEG